ncbi:hypothetical protein WMY93_014923 [Mugilogobius chulae]|uniref:Uncharacterized protein n=1 Tax=Mugilogobius chulae TaxID=88201 RepID=A0AAW0NWR2_9GOBI
MTSNRVTTRKVMKAYRILLVSSRDEITTKSHSMYHFTMCCRRKTTDAPVNQINGNCRSCCVRLTTDAHCASAPHDSASSLQDGGARNIRKLLEQTDTIQFMEKTVREHQDEKEKREPDLSQKEEENRELSTSLIELKQEVREQKRTIKFMEKINLKDEEIKQLNASVEETDQILCEKETERRQLLRNIDDKIQIDEQRMQEVLDQKEQENRQLSTSLQELQQQLQEQKIVIEKTQADNQIEKQKTEDLQTQLGQKEEENRELTTSVQDLKQELEN